MQFGKKQAVVISRGSSTKSTSSSVLQTIAATAGRHHQHHHNRLLLSTSITWDEEEEDDEEEDNGNNDKHKNAAVGAANMIINHYNKDKKSAAATAVVHHHNNANNCGHVIATLTEELRVAREAQQQLARDLASSQALVRKLRRANNHLILNIRSVWSKLPNKNEPNNDDDIKDGNDAATTMLLEEQLRVATAANEALRADLAASKAKIIQLTKDKTHLINKIRSVGAKQEKVTTTVATTAAGTKSENGPAALVLLKQQLQALQLDYDQLAETYHTLIKKKQASTAAAAPCREVKDQVVQLRAQLDQLQRTQVHERHLLTLFRQLGHVHGYKHQLGKAIREAELALACHNKQQTQS